MFFQLFLAQVPVILCNTTVNESLPSIIFQMSEKQTVNLCLHVLHFIHLCTIYTFVQQYHVGSSLTDIY